MNETGKIFGHDWADIQRAQSKAGSLYRTVDLSKPSAPIATADDFAILSQYGSIQAIADAGLHGVADRLSRANNGCAS